MGMKYSSEGLEIPDQTPVEIPIGWETRHGDPLIEMIQRLVREEMSQEAAQQGAETFEEANDFEVPESDEWSSPYELQDMAEEVPIEAGISVVEEEAPVAAGKGSTDASPGVPGGSGEAGADSAADEGVTAQVAKKGKKK